MSFHVQNRGSQEKGNSTRKFRAENYADVFGVTARLSGTNEKDHSNPHICCVYREFMLQPVRARLRPLAYPRVYVNKK